MKVVVGLGNPGPKYAGTRHNVGFGVVEYLAAAPACGPFRSKFLAIVAELTDGGEQVLLVKPETFMNLSGRAVRQVVDFYKLPPADVLVVCDDFNLPLGKLRLRAMGSAGGQNGLADILRRLGTEDIPRLRIGIGAPPPGRDAAGYVLGKFTKDDQPVISESLQRAAEAAAAWVESGIQEAMNKFNAT